MYLGMDNFKLTGEIGHRNKTKPFNRKAPTRPNREPTSAALCAALVGASFGIVGDSWGSIFDHLKQNITIILLLSLYNIILL